VELRGGGIEHPLESQEWDDLLNTGPRVKVVRVFDNGGKLLS